MKVLVIYFSQSGNTEKVARAIGQGAAEAADMVDVKSIKDVTGEMLKAYDLIGLGSPVWKADPPNIRRFYESLPDQKGKHIFSFAVRMTLFIRSPFSLRRFRVSSATVLVIVLAVR